MIQRLAAAMALVGFVVCLVIGGSAGNPFGTVVTRALLAMLGTFVIGLVVGAMARRMLEENVRAHEEKLKNEAVSSPDDGR